MARLKDKVAIVTGGTGGIGRGIAEAFVAEGARVCIADLSAGQCQSVAGEIGESAYGHSLDVCKQQSIDTLVTDTAAELGAIDILVNAAGVFGMQAFTEITAAEFDRIVGVNTRGLLFMTQAVVRYALSGERKLSVVNITSGSGRRPGSDAAVYSLSKAAVISITQLISLELMPQGIRANAIAPGPVQTDMWEQVEKAYDERYGMAPDEVLEAVAGSTPSGRISTPADYLGAAIYLASDESDYVVGQTLGVDGGYFMV
ncbi:MAG: glucose 1-dehydrogenase [Halieaceae bacterium]|nr:glucose 1-dehydrogenase [Halieaceae bacterium]